MNIDDEKVDGARGKVTRKKLVGYVDAAIKEAASDPTLINNLLMSFPNVVS